jgi:molybdate transport system substrate-binding protein
MRTDIFKIQLFLLIFILSGCWVHAVELKVAVASNFQIPAEQIRKLFELETQHKIILIFGSSGKHFAQIANGAPFDIFLAADSSYIDMLEELKLTENGIRKVYAKGKLVLLFSNSKNPNIEAIKKLSKENKLFTLIEFKKLQFSHLAMANPDVAPYGRAAQEVLKKLGVDTIFKNKLVIGENVQQAHQFIATGNAELGFLSMAQVVEGGDSYFVVPENLYSPIVQEAVVLKLRMTI